ncbi:hypothetical protein PG993_003957 [Apiospora rasikravindrae]|uniref:Uncharacterized protein n=1 Tax=Apiospora rasikravindrae TaxID=990691 RepID=A0ABR1U0Y7_9PEZI
MRFSGFSTAALAAFSATAAWANPIAVPEQDAKRGLLGLGGDGGSGGSGGIGLNLVPEVTSKVEGILGHVLGGVLGDGGLKRRVKPRLTDSFRNNSDLNSILNSPEALTVLTRVEGIVGSVVSEGVQAVDWAGELTDGLLGLNATLGGTNDVVSGVVGLAVGIVDQATPLVKGVLGGTSTVSGLVDGLGPILKNVGGIVSKLTGNIVEGTSEEISSVLKDVTGTLHGLVSGVLSGSGGILKLVTGLVSQGTSLLSLTGLGSKSLAKQAVATDLSGPLRQALKFLQS